MHFLESYDSPQPMCAVDGFIFVLMPVRQRAMEAEDKSGLKE